MLLLCPWNVQRCVSNPNSLVASNLFELHNHPDYRITDPAELFNPLHTWFGSNLTYPFTAGVQFYPIQIALQVMEEKNGFRPLVDCSGLRAPGLERQYCVYYGVLWTSM